MIRTCHETQRLTWAGRTFGLKAAYKQVGVSEEDARRLKIALKAGPEEVRFFRRVGLSLGATGDLVVYHRVAASLAFIGTNGFPYAGRASLMISLRYFPYHRRTTPSSTSKRCSGCWVSTSHQQATRHHSLVRCSNLWVCIQLGQDCRWSLHAGSHRLKETRVA